MLTPDQAEKIRAVLSAEQIEKLCWAIDNSQHSTPARALLDELADALQSSDERTAHYLIMSQFSESYVGCTYGQRGQADVDRGSELRKVNPGEICPSCKRTIIAGRRLTVRII